MIRFPERTRIHRRIPKETFYERLEISSALKMKFVSDVDRIFVEHSLTTENLNLSKGSDITEILLLAISLKKKEISGKILEAIARQNQHKLVFLLTYENERQLALFHCQLYSTPWQPEDRISLEARGFSLSEIWENFIEQIALYDERAEIDDKIAIDVRLRRQHEILQMENELQRTETAAWKEVQPKKKFELYQKLQNYKQRLEDLKHGQA